MLMVVSLLPHRASGYRKCKYSDTRTQSGFSSNVHMGDSDSLWREARLIEPHNRRQFTWIISFSEVGSPRLDKKSQVKH